jgi:hypothetical protein
MLAPSPYQRKGHGGANPRRRNPERGTIASVEIGGRRERDDRGQRRGIWSAFGSLLTFREGAISGNRGGGGIWSESVTEVDTGTISGNAAGGGGGGVHASRGNPLLANVTLFGSRAGSGGLGAAGGGIAITAGISVELRNTLVAGNLRGSGEETADDVSGTLRAESLHNLIANAATAGGLTDGTNGNIVGANLAALIDPVLRDNGGRRRRMRCCRTPRRSTPQTALMRTANSEAFPLREDSRRGRTSAHSRRLRRRTSLATSTASGGPTPAPARRSPPPSGPRSE